MRYAGTILDHAPDLADHVVSGDLALDAAFRQAEEDEARARLEGERPKRRRRPLADAFGETVYDLGKRVERLERLVEDDRMPRARGSLSARRFHELGRMRDILDRILDELGPPAR